MKFFLKKLLSRVLFPVPLCVECLVLGLLLWRGSRWKRLGRGLVLLGIGGLVLWGYPAVPNLALGRLESRYQAQGVAMRPAVTEDAPPQFICVLAGSLPSTDRRRPPGARWGELSLQRLAEGVRQHRRYPEATLLVSVPGTALSRAEKERLLEEVLAIFGLSAAGVSMCDTARDTEDEIVWCRRVAGTNVVLLVSCASHLPRAMNLAARHGLQARPCPSGYWVETGRREAWTPDRLFPGAWNLHKSERAAYEYLGLAWEHLCERWPWLRGGHRPTVATISAMSPNNAAASRGGGPDNVSAQAGL